MRPEFEMHELNSVGLERCRIIAEQFDKLVSIVGSMVQAPTTDTARYYSLFKTNLEEACMWAKKSLAFIESNQLNPPASEETKRNY